MNNTDANRMPKRELKDELARLSRPAADREPDRKLAWMNSICILFLLIGIFGAGPDVDSIKPVPPIEEIMPVAIETPPPLQTVTPTPEENRNQDQQPSAPNVVVVVPNAPNISFSVPTIGNLVAVAAMAQAPPLDPMQAVQEPVTQLSRISNTGSGGSRPAPPYPQIALGSGEQGTVTLQMTANAQGRVATLQIIQSSGFPVLDRATEDFIRHHWLLPAGGVANRIFETSITYQLQGN